MKIIGLLVFTSLFFFSCGEKSDSKKTDGNSDSDYTEVNGWTEKDYEEFMIGCMTGLSEEVCDCSFESIKSSYDPSELDSPSESTINGISLAMNECMGIDSEDLNSEDMSGF